MKLNKYVKIILFTSIISSTVGFSEFLFKDDALAETKAYINQVKSSTQPSPEISGLETKMLTPYVPYRLQKSNDDDPFVVKEFVRELGQEQEDDENGCRSDNCGDGPPLPHTPFLLENYNLDQVMSELKMKIL